jgi:hypothetical protein
VPPSIGDATLLVVLRAALSIGESLAVRISVPLTPFLLPPFAWRRAGDNGCCFADPHSRWRGEE